MCFEDKANVSIPDEVGCLSQSRQNKNKSVTPPRYETMTRMYYRDAGAAVVCFDPTDASSYQHARYCIGELLKLEPVRARVTIKPLWVCACEDWANQRNVS